MIPLNVTSHTVLKFSLKIYFIISPHAQAAVSNRRTMSHDGQVQFVKGNFCGWKGVVLMA
jgi:hypothetical protein